MPALAPYIPNKQAQLSAWATNFSTLITASPATYGLMTSDAVTIAAAVAAFNAAYVNVTSPTTRTPAAISAKDTAKTTMLAVVRPYAQNIAKNAGVTSANKIALGLNPQTSTPSPITPPTTFPVFLFQMLTLGGVTLRYRDSAASVSVKGKPYGVRFVNGFYVLSATPITVPSNTGTAFQVTKSPFQLTFPSVTAAIQCYLWGNYLMANGKYSAWSPIINFTVPVGG